jgi:N-acetylmuramoyl-L-alanine amidase
MNNGSVIIHELDQIMSDKNLFIWFMLFNLKQISIINKSLDIEKKELYELSSFANLYSNFVEQEIFIVLKMLDILSQLVEIGFISFDKEKLKLNNFWY